MRLLIVGGYGTFGGRLVDLLKNEARLEIIVAGRSPEKAAAFCSARRDAKAQLVPAVFERRADVPEQLRRLAPDVLVDASGPFQAYGANAYLLIEACIAQRAHYLDLADGSDFVAGVRSYEAAAQAAGVFVLSGVSSFPVLTAAVVRRLATGMTRIDSIRGGIAPSPFAGVGENVIRAIAGYAGQPLALRRRGGRLTAYPFTQSLHFTISPPGHVPLKSTLFSLVDVPDLRVLADLWPDAQEIWMGAGPVPELLHRALIALAHLTRWGLLPSLSPLAHLMFWVTNHLRWGEHRGGMFVAVQGADSTGRIHKRSWHLLAEGDDGPFIPSMAIEAIVRSALDGRAPAAGARAAVRELELEDYQRLFANRRIYIGTRDDASQNPVPLFARQLGEAWNRLPIAIRQIHSVSSESCAEGRCAVERGSGMLSNWAASLFGFPRAGNDLAVSVRFKADSGTECWRRKFGVHVLSTHLFLGRGRSDRLLCERFGVFEFAQALTLEGERLRFVLRRWSAFGIPLPLWLAPRSNSYETVEQGRFRFHVEISYPVIGLIVRYRGWLVVSAPSNWT